jgi:MFS family permease
VVTPFAFLCSVTIFTWLGMTIPGLYVFAIFFGFFQGGMISIQNSAIASICKDMREIGTMMGMGGGFVSLAYVSDIHFACDVAMLILICRGLTGTPIAGAILHSSDGGQDWNGMVGFSAGIIMAGSIFILSARMNQAKWKVVKRV